MPICGYKLTAKSLNLKGLYSLGKQVYLTKKGKNV